MSVYVRCAALVLLAAVSACSVDETPAPPLAGPSEFALGIVVHATPDSVQWDGVSQSLITIDAKGPDGRPVRNVPLRLQTFVDGTPQDVGTLSTKSTVTDFNGSARVTYTAPPRPLESTGPGVLVTVVVTPVGNDYRGEVDRVVDIRLVPPGVIVPPNAVVPDFSFTPETPATFAAVTFNASATTSDGVACGTRCIYSWNFGDGGTGAGMLATHEFRSVGTFAVTLTATNERGQSQSVIKTVTVGAGQAPTATFTFSPTTPLPGQAVFFNASASTAAAGRSIVRYEWDFGTGRFDQGVTVSKTFDAAGSYAITLKVTDDANQVGTATQTVTVGGGSATLPTAAFAFSPSTPTPGQLIFFNASASTAGPGRRIVSYRWDFGSGRTGEGITVSKGYDTPGVYVVTLTVTDDMGQTGTTSQTVTVGGGSATPPTATFVFSPTTPTPNQGVVFDASASTAGPGRRIVSYAWNFGDVSPIVTGPSPLALHTYINPGQYTVTLTVTDDQGQVGTNSLTVPVGTTPPTAQFTFSPNNASAPVVVNFNASGSQAGPGRTIVSYRWDFGNGQQQTVTGPTTSHPYASAGTFVVVLTVTDSAGLTATASQTLTLLP